MRVPTIVSLPGVIEPNSENASASYFADWFPTLASAAGLKNDHEVDGEDLWSSLKSNALFARKSPMVWVFPEYGGQVAVRFGDFKVLRRNLKTRRPLGWEVYNIAEDRSESKNLANERQDLIDKAIETLKSQTDENELFPVPLAAASEK
jgi:arylsulfatase A